MTTAAALTPESILAAIGRRMRIRHPDLADDLVQEARIAIWKEGPDAPVKWLRKKAWLTVVDVLRRERRIPGRAGHVELVEFDDEAMAGTFEEPEHPPVLDDDTALLIAVVLNSQKAVAAALGNDRFILFRKVKAARLRIAARHPEG